jgi:hypothetical protein
LPNQLHTAAHVSRAEVAAHVVGRAGDKSALRRWVGGSDQRRTVAWKKDGANSQNPEDASTRQSFHH